MATVIPFAALRPKPDLAARICELPYDVMSSAEARQIAEGNPLSFLRVSKPEIELPPATDPYAAEVYTRGRDNFRALQSTGSLRQDAQPCFYLYRQVMGGHTQTGWVAVARCQEYLAGTIKKHELTRPDKEDDRVRHIETLNAQTGPVFLVYRANATLDTIASAKTTERPEIDFVAADGVRHTAWVIADSASIQAIANAFVQIPALYIADGHHRSAAAARVCQSRHGAGGSGSFLSVIFPHNQLQILPYNRVLKDLNGHSPARLLNLLETVFEFASADSPTPRHKHELGFFFEGRWRTMRFRDPAAAHANAIERLDVTLLQKQVLAPLFGIDDPRTSQRINFVGGIRGTAELEKLVSSGQYACAFSLFPTGIEDLMTIADAGGIMPPKSTWFEPKLRDAMFCHLI